MTRRRGYPDPTPAVLEGVPFTAGELKTLAPAIERAHALRGPACDFHGRGGDPVVWDYPVTGPMTHLGQVGPERIVGVSFGGWRACQPCADLIEAGDWPALARRSLRESGIAEAVKGGPPGLRVRLLATVTESQRQFRQARAGQRRRIEGPQ